MSLTDIDLRQGISEQTPPETTDAGAAFWAYLSPQNNTESVVKEFRVELSQGSWSGVLTQETTLQTPGLSGIFNVVVMAACGSNPMTQLQPLPNSKPNIGCNSNCKSMIGIVADPNGQGAHYWTTWDALCNGPSQPLG